MAEPPITIRARYSSFTPGSNANPTRVVIHSTAPGNLGYPRASAAGTALSTARYFASPAAGGSSHYVVDVSGEQHCVPDDTVAYHAPPNEHSLGIEICSELYSRDQWLSPQVWPAVQRAASRTAELCHRFALPTVRIGPDQLRAGARGICGHIDVTNAFHQTDHIDPGPDFPWAEFLAAVTGTGSGSAREDDPVAPIAITPAADGTFRSTAMAEAGVSSAVVARSWLTVGSTFGGAHVKITALDTNGNAMGPAGMLERDLTNNRRAVLELPSGVVMVTIEGRVSDGAVVAAALVNLPK